MAKDEKKIKELEEALSAKHNRFVEACNLVDRALAALEVRGFGAPAAPIRQELNKIKP